MALQYTIPSWLFGIDITLELIFWIITLAVAIIAYKVYKISRENSMKCFSIGFLLVSLSYLVWAIINIFALSEFMEFSLQKAFSIGIVGIYAYILLLSIGLITIAYAILPKKNSRVYYIMLGLGLIAIVSSANKIITFRAVSVLLLSVIVYHFFVQWREHKSKNLLYSAIAFSLLLLSNLEFALSANYYTAYVVGHFLELAAYSIILRNLVKIAFIGKTSSNEQKKNKA